MQFKQVLIWAPMIAVPLAALTWLALPTAQPQPQRTVADHAKQAQKVVVGTVTSASADYAPPNEYGDKLIVSHLTVKVEETLKGDPQPDVDLDVEGGTVGTGRDAITLNVSDAEPPPVKGDRAVFFIAPEKNGKKPARGHTILKVDKANRVKHDGKDEALEDVTKQIKEAK